MTFCSSVLHDHPYSPCHLGCLLGNRHYPSQIDMLATRGYVYSKETVGGAHERFHDKCKRSAGPQYPGEELPKLVQDAQKAYDEFVYPNGSSEPAPDGQANFFDFVRDGGLGDSPVPGRDSQGITVARSTARTCRSAEKTHTCTVVYGKSTLLRLNQVGEHVATQHELS